MRFTQLLLAALILLASIFACGCSNRAERLVGNQRLVRGPGGLGTTVIQGPAIDRDTYVTPGTANYGSTVLVGRNATFEAHVFFKAAKFSLPDTSRLGFTPGDVLFEMPRVPLRHEPNLLDLDFGLTNSAVADSGMMSWPGPDLGVPLASITYDFSGPLRMSLGPGSFAQFKQWALDPASVPGFILRAPLVQGLTGFQGGAARFRVPYTWNNGGVTAADTINTTVSYHVYLHPPLSPAPTGADTALFLGGGFEARLAVRAPLPAIPPGASVNQLRLVFSVIDSLPGVDGSTLKNTTDTSRVALSLAIYRITGAWPEGATDEASTPHDVTPTALILGIAAGPGDSLSIPLPPSIARGWAETPASNQGILVLVTSGNVSPGLVVGSRESSRPPVLRLSTTSPPPGRF